MLNVMTSKKIMVIVVFIFLLMQMEALAGGDWELITELSTKRLAFATAVVEGKIYLIGGTL